MKSILTVFGILINLLAYSKCGNSGIDVFPTTTEINKNSIFLIEGFATSQKIITSLNKEYKIYLQNGDQKINLKVTETLVGDFQLTQAILKPEFPLEIGKEYILKIDNLPKYETIDRFYNYNITSKPITYKVTSNVDTEKPIFTKKPFELKKSYIPYGCGPEVNVYFSLLTNDSSLLLVKTKFKNLVTNKVTTFYLLVRDNKLAVGYGMCSGAFKYDKNLVYEVEFDLMDSSGNITEWNMEGIKFTRPTEANLDDGE